MFITNCTGTISHHKFNIQHAHTTDKLSSYFRPHSNNCQFTHRIYLSILGNKKQNQHATSTRSGQWPDHFFYSSHTTTPSQTTIV